MKNIEMIRKIVILAYTLMLVTAQQGIFIEYFENSTNLALVNAKFRGISTSQAASSSDESKYTCDLDYDIDY